MNTFFVILINFVDVCNAYSRTVCLIYLLDIRKRVSFYATQTKLTIFTKTQLETSYLFIETNAVWLECTL